MTEVIGKTSRLSSLVFTIAAVVAALASVVGAATVVFLAVTYMEARRTDEVNRRIDDARHRADRTAEQRRMRSVVRCIERERARSTDQSVPWIAVSGCATAGAVDALTDEGAFTAPP